MVMRFLVLQYCIATICFTSALTGRRSSSLTAPSSSSSSSIAYDINSNINGATALREKKKNNINKRHSSVLPRRSTTEKLDNELEASSSINNNEDDDNAEHTASTSSSSTNYNSNNNNNNNNNSDDVVIALLTKDDTVTTSSTDTSSSISTSTSTSTSASRWNRRKQIALGLVASIAVTAGGAKMGWLPGPPILSDVAASAAASASTSTATFASAVFGTTGTYTDGMILRDSGVTMVTSALAVAMNRCITWGYEHDKYDSCTGRKITHILSAPLFIVTWPLFSNAVGARFFAGLVTLTNMYRLYLAGTGDAAESSLAKTISRSGDQSEVLGGPFIYVCLFQLFLLAFWRNSFPGVVAMTVMAAGDGMADIIGRRYGKNGYKWPWSDGQKSRVGTVAFALSASVLTTAVCGWLIATGSLQLPSSLTFSDMVQRIVAISFICAIVELLPVGDDNYTVPGSAALLSAFWLR